MMNNKVILPCFLFAVLITVSSGCKHKPAYSDIDANRPANKNQNEGAQPGAAQPGATESQPAPPPAPTPSVEVPRPPVIKQPRFLDQARGNIRDLPEYPGARRSSMQIGPSGEANIASITLQTGDPMDKIVAFYDRVIKTNRWTVLNKVIDQEASEWRLSKGQDDSAKIEVKKDPQTGWWTILLVRGESLEPVK